ncbi:sporulation protein YabP [Natronospora cellulosivora (SeqCode)]
MNKIEEKTNTGQKLHKLNLSNRKELEISGVQEVISFNEDKILLQTIQGILDIKGSELNIQNLNLDDANIKVSGLIFSLIYSDKQKEKSILKKIFK